MKDGWIVKKLGEVCEVLTDGDWIESKDQSPEGIRLIQTGNIGNGIYKDKIEHSKFISEETFDRLNCTEIFEGDILISRLPEPIGRACIMPKKKDRMITAVDCSIVRLKDIMMPKFFVFYTLSNNYSKGIEKYVTGAVRKRISRANLSKIAIPVPPLPEQSRIVEELDQLSNIIEKKREQLSELDNLAQSIFYDMFGDPVVNDKGWEVKTIDQLFDLKAGKAIKANELRNEYADGLYACYGGNGIRGYIAKCSHSGIYPIIGRQGALCGNVNLAKGDFYATEHAVVVSSKENNDMIWTYYCMSIMNFNRYAKGVAQPGISVNVINGINIIHPSFQLQQLFAQKIEAIEKEKELIKQSIAETEELFNSRMDYYFG